MSNIGIVGFGFVGQSLAAFLGPCYIYDPAKYPDSPQDVINKCKYAFVCVPTPSSSDMSCDTSIVEEVVGWIQSEYIIIRSTVAPGTTDRLKAKTGKHIIFQPEYIGETANHPLADHKNQDFIILGGDPNDTNAVAELYKKYYNSDVKFYFTTAKCAELTKYMENAFLATKVIFCNEFYDISKAIGVNYNELRELWLADPRIGRSHTFVYPENRGFDGNCLVKDVKAIAKAAHDAGCEGILLPLISEINRCIRAPGYIPEAGSGQFAAKTVLS